MKNLNIRRSADLRRMSMHEALVRDANPFAEVELVPVERTRPERPVLSLRYGK